MIASDDHNPLVSVLMTSFNREKYIAQAIESVLSSTYKNFELIICDDCSTDDTVSIARSFEKTDNRIKVYVNENNLAQFQNRNKAATYASGKYIKYLDSDDIIYNYGLEVMVLAMEKFPEAGIGFSNSRYDESQPLPYLVKSDDAYREHYFKGGFLFPGPTGAIYKTDFFNEKDKFNVKYDVAADYEFNLRAACYKPVVIFNRDLFWWRSHPDQEINLRKNLYENLNFDINNFYLKSEDCPLTTPERSMAINNLRNLLSRNILQTISRLDLKQGSSKYKKYNITLPDLFFSLLPSAWRRKMQKN